MTRHFGEMLLERRRQMGASIQQVANVIKIRPQIIEYFETENFAAMPPRGYSQGIIASYARFLGLNPREVVDAYFDALHEYERNGSGGRAGRFQDAAADANPRSSNAAGRYMMVNSVPASRYGQRPPQAGYVSEFSSAHEPVSASRLRPVSTADSRRRPSQGGYDSTLRSRTRRPDGYLAFDQRDPRAHASRSQDGRSYRDPRGPRGTYPDQRPIRRASGGQSPRGGAGRGQAPRGGSRPPQQGPDMKFLAIMALGILILIALVMVLLRGCAPKPEAAGSASSTPSAQKGDSKDTSEDSTDVDEGGDSSTDEGDDADEPSSSKDKADKSSKDEEPKETIVKVKLKEKGAVAWIEVKLDGKIVLGKQVVGPFEEEFKVETQIDITTNTPSAVAIYKNGDKVRYDTKVSGVGKVSILAPKKEEPEKVVDSDGDGTPDMTIDEAKEAGVTIPEDVLAAAEKTDEPTTEQ